MQPCPHNAYKIGYNFMQEQVAKKELEIHHI
jgi:hypothetical protein